MTFPYLPFRPSSEDDALDTALNAWTAGDQTKGENDLAANALEFHRWVDDALRTDPAATGPAADTWSRVLRQTAQVESRGESMNAISLGSPMRTSNFPKQPLIERQHVSKYLNYAASLLIVFGVAFAGAFMAMQINQPGGSNGQFAVLGQSDAGTCDVEPLSVDRVMEIVKNPYLFMKNGPAGEPATGENADNDMYSGLQEATIWQYMFPVRKDKTIPAEEDFGNASAFANHYLNCVFQGTRGQIWTFLGPAEIQADVLRNFPVFATEADVLAWVTANIDSPPDGDQGSYQWLHSRFIKVDATTVSVNPDRNLAYRQAAAFGPEWHVITFGIKAVDADGNTVILTNANGSDLKTGGQNGLKVIVRWQADHGRWEVLLYDPVAS